MLPLNKKDERIEIICVQAALEGLKPLGFYTTLACLGQKETGIFLSRWLRASFLGLQVICLPLFSGG